jgi:hypothetical protein
MGDLDGIIKVSISRETQAITRAGFGVPAIIAEFPTSQTTPVFDRYRFYTGITAMADEGWSSGDAVYDAATILFSQNPKVSRIMVGRKDSGDDDWTEAFNEIQLASQDWYTFSIIASNAGTVVFDIDFVTGNLIDFTINGTAVTQVPFNATQAATMADLKTQIETDITDSTVTIDTGDPNTRTLIIEVFGDIGVESVSVVVTGGGTQPVGAITYVNEDDYKEAAAWAQTQKKIFFFSSSSAAIKDPGSTSDIAYFMKNTGYDRTATCYHIASQGDADPAYFECGMQGEALPYDPGSQTWAFKTISGVAAYNLTGSEEIAMIGTAENPTSGKNVNIYTTKAGVNITQWGQVASGEYIDIMRGLDWVEARIQEELYLNLLNTRKVHFTDEGILTMTNAVESVLDEAARQGIAVKETITVTAPAIEDIPTGDRLARHLPDVEFSFTLQGAIHSVEVNGVATV